MNKAIGGLWPFILLAIITGSTNVNTLWGDFLYDDWPLISNNVWLRGWDHLHDLLLSCTTCGSGISGTYYRPVQMMMYAILYNGFGADPVVFHVFNLVIHTANVLLIYALAVRIKFNRVAMVIASSLWAVHPIHTEAVAYISGIVDLLSTFFIVCGLHVLWPSFSWKRIVLSSPFFALALFSKESSIAFPLLIMVMLSMHPQRTGSVRWYVQGWPLWGAVVAYASIHFMLIPEADVVMVNNAHPPVSEGSPEFVFGVPAILTYIATLGDYSRLLLWPTGLHFERDYPQVQSWGDQRFWLGFVLCIGFVLTVFCKRHRSWSHPLRWGGLFFLAGSFLYNGVLVALERPFLEHYVYMASVGLFLGSAQAVFLWGQGRVVIGRMAVGAGLLGVAVLMALTYQQNRVWHDTERLCKAVFAAGEVGIKCHNNLGVYYANKNDLVKALHEFTMAIEKSGDRLAQARANAGIVLLNQPDSFRFREIAARHLERAIELDPQFLHALRVLRMTYKDMGELGKMDVIQSKIDAMEKNAVTP